MNRYVLSLALAGALLAAAPVHAEQVDTLKDTSRVVAVGGAVTEIVYALGLQDKLIARDSTSVYPPEANTLPDVGYMRQLAPEGVLSVNPSGIIALEGAGPKEAVDVLKKAAVPYVEVPETYDHKGIIERIERVGKALGAEGKAADLASRVDGKLKDVEAETAKVKEPKRVLFILSLQGGKVLASGAGTAADGIVKMAGAQNVVTEYPGYKQLSDEAVIAANPEVILMMDRGGPNGASADEVLSHPAIASTIAGKEKKLIRMDGGYLLSFGPRTADAIHDLVGQLYGDKLAN